MSISARCRRDVTISSPRRAIRPVTAGKSPWAVSPAETPGLETSRNLAQPGRRVLLLRCPGRPVKRPIDANGVGQPNIRQNVADAMLGQLLHVVARGPAAQNDLLAAHFNHQIADPLPGPFANLT